MMDTEVVKEETRLAMSWTLLRLGDSSLETQYTLSTYLFATFHNEKNLGKN